MRDNYITIDPIDKERQRNAYLPVQYDHGLLVFFRGMQGDNVESIQFGNKEVGATIDSTLYGIEEGCFAPVPDILLTRPHELLIYVRTKYAGEYADVVPEFYIDELIAHLIAEGPEAVIDGYSLVNGDLIKEDGSVIFELDSALAELLAIGRQDIAESYSIVNGDLIQSGVYGLTTMLYRVPIIPRKRPVPYL